MQDSVVGDDPTLPVDFDASNNLSMLPDVTTGPPDISSASGGLERLPDGSIPGIQKINSGRMSPIRAHTMKDYEQQISELKKENFSLKLRIYFMEERLQPNFEENDDIKTNIELKVEVESLKKDLMDKQQLLVKASNAVESLVQEKEAIAERLKEENRKALEQLRERLQAESDQAKKEVKQLNEAMKDLQKQLDDVQQQTEEDKGVVPSDEQQTRIQELEDALKDKDVELGQLHALEDDVKKKDVEIKRLHDLEDALKRKDDEIEEMKRKEDALMEDLKNTREELESIPSRDQDDDMEKDTRLKDLEAACEDKDQQLEDKDAEIKGLKDDLGKAKKGLEDVNNDLTNKEASLKSHESNAMKRDKAIQGLTEMVRSKDKEIQKLCDQIDEKDTALSQAKEALHRAEKVKYEGLEQYQASMSDMDTKLDEAKAALHRKGLENERLQRAIARKTDELEKLRENSVTTDAQTDELLAEKDAIIKDLKEELAEAKGQADNRVDGLKDHYQNLLDDSQKQLQAKEQTIQRLTKGLQEKDKHIQEDNDGKELVIQSLRDRLKQRDKAVEDAIEEKFQVAEDKDGEIRKLRVALRERDRELEKANGELLGAEDKINSLEDEVQEKDAKNRQLRDANRAQTKAKKEAEEGHQQALKEKDALIGGLQNALADKDKSIEGLQDSNVGGKNRDELIQQLNERIIQKDKLIKEILTERDQMAKANEKDTNDLLGTIMGKDDQIKELHDRHNKMMASKNDMLKEMQKQLDEKELEIQSAEDTLAQAEHEQGALLNKMRNALAEKDKTIEKLLASNQEKDRLFWELQKAAEKAPPESPELLSAERMRLTAELAQAKRKLAEKQALIDELSALAHPQSDDTDSLKAELESKNRLLGKAKSTIDALQRDQKGEKQLRMDMAKMRRQNIELQSELQAKQDHIDALIHAGKVKDNIIQELRLQETGVPVRNGAVGGDSNSQLQQALADHLAELSNLSDALKSERQLYVNITQSSQPPAPTPSSTGGSPSHGGHTMEPSHALDIELSAVQALRKQLEEGIKRNKEIRNNLLKQQPSANTTGNEASPSTNPEEQAAEIQALRDQLEESRRWNASLQMRLDEMKQRADGVGSDVEPVIHTMRNQEEEPRVESQQDEEEEEDSESGEDEEEVQRRKSLEDRQDLESVRSIPGQEMPSKRVPTNAQKQLEDLQTKLAQSEGERNMLTQQLEAVMLNQNQPETDGGPVVPILKQQLDQAKTLLMEKDRKIQEKEQQNQALRHHLGIGPSSPITPGRSMMAGFSQENTRLQRELQDAKAHNKNLEHHIQGLKGQCIKLKQVNEALQKQLEKLAQTNSSDDEQLGMLANELGNTKAQLQGKVEENEELRQMLGLEADGSVADGQNLVDKLKQDIAKLQKQLEDIKKELEDTQMQLDLTHKELDERPLGGDGKAEIARLKKQLSSADKLNELLKRHIELNSSADPNQSFNPELIVDMAKEIENLQEQLDGKAGGDNGDQPDSAGAGKDSGSKDSGSKKEKSTISAYKRTLRKVEGDLDEAKQKVRTLQRKLQATEGTVHRQADKIKQYRREMHNAGIAPPGTPKRVQSDSNLLQSSLLGSRFRSMSNFSTDSASSSTSLSPAPSEQGLAVSEMSFNDFGSTDDITELKEQIGVLKNQLQRLRRAIRHLQRRLRASEGSRSPSPTRSLNDSWFELTANQDAFEKMRLELENLRDQLNQTNVANLTLQERNIELHHQLSTVVFDSKQEKGSQTKPINVDPVNEEQLKKLNKELQDRRNLNKKLRDLLAENQKVAEETGRDLERLAKEVEEKNSTIGSLRKQLRQARMSRSPRTSANGQDQSDPLRKRSQTAPGLDRPHDAHTKGNNDEPDSTSQQQFTSRTHISRTHKKTRTVQTDQWSNATTVSSSDESSSTRAEVDHLKTKVREMQRLNKTLKTELEIYRKVLDGWSEGGAVPDGRPQPQDHQDPNDVLKEHLEEIRALRKRLEESINVNDRLREQLEAKLAGTDSESEGTTNIHLHQTNIEISEENNSLKVLIQEKEHMIKEVTEEATKSRVKLQRMMAENQRLKEQIEENTHLAESLKFELSVYEHLQQKDSKEGSPSSFPSARITDPSSGIDLTELLREIRHLRIQLERSIDTNNALRLKLEEMMSEKNGTKKSPVTTYRISTTETVENRRDSTAKRELFRDDKTSNSRPMSNGNSTDEEMYSRHQQRDHSEKTYSRRQQKDHSEETYSRQQQRNPSERLRSSSSRTHHYNQDIGAEIEEPQFYSMPPGAGHMNTNIHIPSKLTNGAASVHLASNQGDALYAVCTLSTYNAIHRSTTESCVIGKLMETKLLGLRGEPMSVKKCQDLLKNVKFLISHLDECIRHLSLFWKSKLTQNDELVAKLKKRLSVQEKTMREALHKLTATNRMKEGMEQAIIDQLDMTHTVLRQARGNLEAQPRPTSATSSD